jgi:hypothetical protein
MSGLRFWDRSQEGRLESERAGAVFARRLTAWDRCDRCGAQAYVRVLLPSHLELLFCAHHHRQYAPALREIAVAISDETHLLAGCAA